MANLLSAALACEVTSFEFSHIDIAEHGQTAVAFVQYRQEGKLRGVSRSGDWLIPVAREQRELAAILAADVVGYSRLIRPTLENILRRHAKHDLTDRLVVQYAPLALLRDRVDVAQTAFERIFLEHRRRAAIVKQRIDDLP